MAANKNASDALARNRAVLEEANHNNILQAILRIRNGNPEKIRLKPAGKVTVADLAKESGVSRASLYGNHKLLLVELEKINTRRSVSISEKRKQREKKAETDKEIIKQLSISKEQLAQENYRINEENKMLKRQVELLISQLGSEANVISGRFKK